MDEPSTALQFPVILRFLSRNPMNSSANIIYSKLIVLSIQMVLSFLACKGYGCTNITC